MTYIPEQNPLPVTGPATDAELRAIPVPVSGTVAVSNLPVTQTVAGTVAVSNLPATQPISGAVAVSNFPATQPISGTVAVSNHPASQAVTGAFFQATQPVSAAALPLPSGASTEATLAAIKAKTDNLDVALSTRTKPADTQTVAGTVAVSNFPATQPVSGTVAISNLPATQAVTGTFFQATQPVSGTVTATGPLTDAQLRAAPVPVSGTVTANAGTGTPDTTATGTLGALNASVQVSLAGMQSAGFQMAAGTLLGTLAPEVSYDGGTTWLGTAVIDPVTGTKIAGFSFGVSQPAIARTFQVTGGVGLVRLRVSAYTSGTTTITLRASAVVDNGILAPVSAAGGGAIPSHAVQIGGTDGTAFRILSTDLLGRVQVINTGVDGYKTAYSATATAAPLAVAATDVFAITGSAAKLVRVTRIEVSGTQTTAGIVSVLVTKRSTANSGGTSTAPAMVPHDSLNAAAVASVLLYSANPTIGTTVGVVRSDKLLLPAPAGTSQAPPLVFDFGTRNGQAMVLRVNQVLAVSFNGATVAGGSLNFNVEWTEE